MMAYVIKIPKPQLAKIWFHDETLLDALLNLSQIPYTVYVHVYLHVHPVV